MRKAEIYRNGIFAGILLEENRSSYVFAYDDAYFFNQHLPAISLSLPKNKKEHRSNYLFPFFSNMIAEGANLAIQESYLKIDSDDVLSLLGATAGSDTIGAITVKLIEKT